MDGNSQDARRSRSLTHEQTPRQGKPDLATMKRARLKDALDRGYEDVAAGRVIQLDNEDQIDALFAGRRRPHHAD